MTDDHMSWAHQNITGIWLVPQLPFRADESIDEPALAAVFEKSMELDATGVGSSMLMEPWSLTHEERMRCVEVMVDTVAARRHTMVNITDHSIAETLRLGRHSLDRGVDLLLANCPYEWAKSEEEAVAWFEYLVDRLDGKVLLYNTPHSGLLLSPEAIARLAERDNVVGIKNAISDPAHSARVRELVGDSLIVSHPFEENYLENIKRYGQPALLSTTASLLMQSATWQPIRDYAQLMRAGEEDAARQRYAELEPLRKVWTDSYADSHDLAHATHPLAITKYWQGLVGYPTSPVRPPLPQLPDAAKAQLIDALEPFVDRLDNGEALLRARAELAR